MKKDLFFAMTPLHMLICEDVCKLRDLDLIVSGDNSDKSHYYFSRLEKNPNIYITRYLLSKKRKGIFSRAIYLIYLSYIFLLMRIKNGGYDNIYIGNVNFKVHFLALYILKYNNIITYDDGLVNLIKEGSYSYTENNKSFFIDRNYILNKAIKHYTIFPEIEDKNTYYLNLFKDVHVNQLNTNKSIILFVGQPLHELDMEFNEKFISTILGKFNIDFYFPHPREDLDIFKIKYVKTNMILEDYIVHMLNESISIEVLGFYSTALINLKNIFPNLMVSYIYEKNIFSKKELDGVEDIFKNFKIKRMEVD